MEATKNPFYLFFSLILLLAFACSSDDEISNPPEPIPDPPIDTCSHEFLVQYSFPQAGTAPIVYGLKYNEEELPFEQVILAENNDTFPDYFFEYDESGNLLKKSSPIGPNLVTQIYEWEYENNQRIKNIYSTSVSPGAPISETQNIYFTWENEKLKLVQFEQAEEIFAEGQFSYSNNDKTVHYDYTFLDGTNVQQTTYYYSELINPIANINLSFGFPVSNFALDSLVRSMPNEPDQINRYQYELDDKNRIVKTFIRSYYSEEYRLLYEFLYDCLPE